MDVATIIKQAATLRGRYAGLTPVYRNDPAIDALFQWTLNFAHLETTVMQASASSLQSTAGVGVDTGPIISLFLKLKAGFQTTGTVEDAVKTVGTDDHRLSLLALAEATLEGADRLTRDPAQDPPAEYFRFWNVFSGYAPGQQAELMAAVGPDVGKVVVDRWAIDDNLFPDVLQFAYATIVPRAMAAILIVPPNPDRRIAGDSTAPYPPFGSRVFFGRFGAVQQGVRFVNTMYYVADGDMPVEMHHASTHSTNL